MTVRYKYNNATYETLYDLRNAVWMNQRIIIDALPDNPEQLAQLGITVENEQYDPILEMDLEHLRTYALTKLKTEFQTYGVGEQAYINSTLGFKSNANYTALLNVQGLSKQLATRTLSADEQPTVTFRDYNNEFHELTLDDCVVLESEITYNGELAYQKMWNYEQSINSALDNETLSKILQSGFNFNTD